jgi:hypothetical protein
MFQNSVLHYVPGDKILHSSKVERILESLVLSLS